MKTLYLGLGRSVAIGLFCASLQGGLALAKDQVQEEFHQSYPLTPNGRLRLDNVNGKVRITAWDRAEVKVDAVKRADQQERLDQVKIEIESAPDQIRIHTRYPESGSRWRLKYESPSVDYEIKVPVQARIDRVHTVNGSLDIEGVQGAVHASTVNGHMHLRGLADETALESVNGTVEAAFDRVEGVKSITLKTVNGKVELALPPNTDAELSAKTVNGNIRTDDDLTVQKNWPVGRELHGKLGKGGTRIKAETVNGSINIRHTETR
jgi:DUF4097 and DUF4098 domain-containing protein YvlB